MNETTKKARINPTDKICIEYADVTINDIRKAKTNLRRRLERKSSVEIAKDYPDVARGTLHRFAVSDYVPKDPQILSSIGVRLVPRLAVDALGILHGCNKPPRLTRKSKKRKV